MSNFNEINKHERDNNIQFTEDGHIYSLSQFGSYENMFISSVTTVVNKFKKNDFDPYLISKRIVSSKDYLSNNAHECDYVGMTYEEILEYFLSGQPSRMGTRLHNRIERYLLGEKHVDEEFLKNHPEIHYFKQVMNHFKEFDVYRTEWLLYDEELLICGALDCLLKHKKDGSYVMIDWKRAKKMTQSDKVRGSGYMLYPLNHLYASSLVGYYLQQNMYRKLLQKYGINVSTMYLAILHPKEAGPILYEVPILEHEIDLILNVRRRDLEFTKKVFNNYIEYHH